MIKLGRVKLILIDYSFEEEVANPGEISNEMKELSHANSLNSNLQDF